MEVIPLGVGSAFAKVLGNTNFLIRPAVGESFLIDCGTTTTRALYRMNIDLEQNARVILSHLHADHIGGLEELGFRGLFMWGKKAELHVPDTMVDILWENCLQGGMWQELPDACGNKFHADLKTYFDVKLISAGKDLYFGSVVVTPFVVPHVPGRICYGYRVFDHHTGKKVMFTCDSKLSMDNLETYGQDADAIFHDCQFNGGETIHARLSELMDLPDEYQKKMLLVHYGDEFESYMGKTGHMTLATEGKSYLF